MIDFCSSFDRFPFSPFTLSPFLFLCQIVFIFIFIFIFIFCFYICNYICFCICICFCFYVCIYIGIFGIRAYAKAYSGINFACFVLFLHFFCTFSTKNPSLFLVLLGFVGFVLRHFEFVCIIRNYFCHTFLLSISLFKPNYKSIAKPIIPVRKHREGDRP